jgi:hypothetical protein
MTPTSPEGEQAMSTATLEKPSMNGTGTTVKVETITPAKARKLLLEANTHNRKLVEKRVIQLVLAMQSGDWMFNGDPIRIGADGVLYDGQHRLAAIERANTPQQMVVVRGLQTGTQETIDVGAKRTIADMLKLRGEKDVNRLAAITRMVMLYKTTQTFRNPQITPTAQMVLGTLEQHPGIRDALGPISPVLRNTRFASGSLGACYFLFSRVDMAEADVFYARLALGAELEETNPIYALRRIGIRSNQVGTRISAHVQGALIIKAWNKWRAGEETRHLAWRAGGSIVEKFPLVDGLDPKTLTKIED